MTTYEEPVHELLKKMVSDIKLARREVLSKKDTIDWFRRNYPLINSGTVECHLTRMSVNAPSRLHYNVVPRRDDLLFKIDSQTFRLYEPGIDPQPIWSEMHVPSYRNRKTPKLRDKDYRASVDKILENLEEFHFSFYELNTFTGPSLFFHRKALATIECIDSKLLVERIYATLVAWGMHRMGNKGAKMVAFEVFFESIDKLQNELEVARKIDYQDVRESDWYVLEKVFKNIRVMATGSSLVGNSKVMAHLLPHLIPPIDRSYTLKYLQGHTNIRNGLDYEWKLMKGIISGFFFPVAKSDAFLRLSGKWLNQQNEYPWDTSLLKILDNLVIAAVGMEAKSAD